jgi:hypothetical protein
VNSRFAGKVENEVEAKLAKAAVGLVTVRERAQYLSSFVARA